MKSPFSFRLWILPALGIFLLACGFCLPLRSVLPAGGGAPVDWLFLALGGGFLAAWAAVKYLLPALGGAIADFIYGDAHLASDEPLLRLTDEARRTRSAEALERLRRFAEENPRRLRAWTEYAAALKEYYGRPREAAGVYEQAAARVRGMQDKALLLYRAACLYDALGVHDKALSLWREAARRHPRAAYGRASREKLEERGKDLPGSTGCS